MKIFISLILCFSFVKASAASKDFVYVPPEFILYNPTNSIDHMQVTTIRKTTTNGIETSYSYQGLHDVKYTDVTVTEDQIVRELKTDPGENRDVLMPDGVRGRIRRLFANGVAQVEYRAKDFPKEKLFYLEELRRLGHCETLLSPQWASLVSK